MGTKTNLTDLWRARGKGYRKEFSKHSWIDRVRFSDQERQILKTLKQLEFSSVLEIGCGYGRLTKLITDSSRKVALYRYDAFDVSEEQIKNARRYVGFINSLEVSSVKEYQFEPRSHDLVCAFEVFMHLPPEEIEEAVCKAVGSAKRYVVNVDWRCEGEAKQAGGYCWQHDYTKLYLNAGASLVETIPLDTGLVKKIFPRLKLRQKLFVAHIEKESS